MEVVKAILLLGHKYVLQLRDDKPDIASPNLWGVFGGEREPNETPTQAMQRELEEELELRPHIRFLWRYDAVSPFTHAPVRNWVFTASLDGSWGKHCLHEGQAVDAFAYEDLPRERLAGPAAQVLERFHAWQRGRSHAEGNL